MLYTCLFFILSLSYGYTQLQLKYGTDSHSQESRVGGCRVHVSSQLEHLPGTGGGTPDQLGGTQEGGKGRRSGGRIEPALLRGSCGTEGVPTHGVVHLW